MMGEYLILGCLIVGITYHCLLSVGGDKPSSLPALHSHSQRKGSFPLMIRCSYVSSLLPTLSKHSPFSSTRVPNRLSRRTLPLSWCTGKVSLAILPALCNFGSFWGTSYFSSNLNNWSSGSLDSNPNAKAFVFSQVICDSFAIPCLSRASEFSGSLSAEWQDRPTHPHLRPNVLWKPGHFHYIRFPEGPWGALAISCILPTGKCKDSH